MTLATTFGFLHVASYLLARLGNVEQVRKILARKRRVRKVQRGKGAPLPSWTRNISEWYRGLTALVFLTMILWSLSLPKIDWFVAGTRAFAFVCFLAVLRERWRDTRRPLAGGFLYGSLILSVLAALYLGLDWAGFKAHTYVFAVGTALCAIPMIGGIGHKTYVIHRSGSVGEQSGWEIITQLFKDTTGVSYGLVLGFDKAWPFVVLLCCTFLARSVNGVIYLRYRKFEDEEALA